MLLTDTSMNKDKDDEDKTIESEKQQDSSFIQTRTLTQMDFPNGDSISSRASTVIAVVTTALSEVAGLKTNRIWWTRLHVCQTNNQTSGKNRSRNQTRRKLPGLIHTWTHL